MAAYKVIYYAGFGPGVSPQYPGQKIGAVVAPTYSPEVQSARDALSAEHFDLQIVTPQQFYGYSDTPSAPAPVIGGKQIVRYVDQPYVPPTQAQATGQEPLPSRPSVEQVAAPMPPETTKEYKIPVQAGVYSTAQPKEIIDTSKMSGAQKKFYEFEKQSTEIQTVKPYEAPLIVGGRTPAYGFEHGTLTPKRIIEGLPPVTVVSHAPTAVKSLISRQAIPIVPQYMPPQPSFDEFARFRAPKIIETIEPGMIGVEDTKSLKKITELQVSPLPAPMTVPKFDFAPYTTPITGDVILERKAGKLVELPTYRPSLIAGEYAARIGESAAFGVVTAPVFGPETIPISIGAGVIGLTARKTTEFFGVSEQEVIGPITVGTVADIGGSLVGGVAVQRSLTAGVKGLFDVKETIKLKSNKSILESLGKADESIISIGDYTKIYRPKVGLPEKIYGGLTSLTKRDLTKELFVQRFKIGVDVRRSLAELPIGKSVVRAGGEYDVAEIIPSGEVFLTKGEKVFFGVTPRTSTSVQKLFYESSSGIKFGGVVPKIAPSLEVRYGIDILKVEPTVILGEVTSKPILALPLPKEISIAKPISFIGQGKLSLTSVPRRLGVFGAKIPIERSTVYDLGLVTEGLFVPKATDQQLKQFSKLDETLTGTGDVFITSQSTTESLKIVPRFKQITREADDISNIYKIPIREKTMVGEFSETSGFYFPNEKSIYVDVFSSGEYRKEIVRHEVTHALEHLKSKKLVFEGLKEAGPEISGAEGGYFNVKEYKDFFKLVEKTGKAEKGFITFNEALDKRFYLPQTGVIRQESVARIAEYFPEELITPKTSTSEYLKDLYKGVEIKRGQALIKSEVPLPLAKYERPSFMGVSINPERTKTAFLTRKLETNFLKEELDIGQEFKFGLTKASQIQQRALGPSKVERVLLEGQEITGRVVSQAKIGNIEVRDVMKVKGFSVELSPKGISYPARTLSEGESSAGMRSLQELYKPDSSAIEKLAMQTRQASAENVMLGSQIAKAVPSTKSFSSAYVPKAYSSGVEKLEFSLKPVSTETQAFQTQSFGVFPKAKESVFPKVSQSFVSKENIKGLERISAPVSQRSFVQQESSFLRSSDIQAQPVKVSQPESLKNIQKQFERESQPERQFQPEAFKTPTALREVASTRSPVRQSFKVVESFKTSFLPRTDTRVSFNIKPPTIKPPPPTKGVSLPKFDLKPPKYFTGKAFGKGYVPFAKVKGKLRQLTGKSLSFEQAYNVGAKFVKGTSARTFELKQRGFAALAPQGLETPYQFRAPKKFRSLAFIEKSKFAINTPGEFSEISYKGIAANKYKAFKGRLF